MLLERLVPEYHYVEVHSAWLGAPPERALAAVRSVTLGEMPLVRLLFAVRSLPALVAGKRGLPTGTAEPLYEQMLDFGFVLLAEKPERELGFGGIGQMFRASGGSRPAFRDADGFRAFGKPGYAKVAMNFSAEARAGGTELRTETRVLATDAASRRRFGRYWRLIRPGSALVRRRWLRAAKRRAESAGPGARAASAGGVSWAALVSLAVALVGAASRLAPPACWGALVACILLYVLCKFRRISQPVADASPFAHSQRLLAANLVAWPLVWLVAIAAALAAFGLARLGHRDL